MHTMSCPVDERERETVSSLAGTGHTLTGLGLGEEHLPPGSIGFLYTQTHRPSGHRLVWASFSVSPFVCLNIFPFLANLSLSLHPPCLLALPVFFF